MELAMIKEPIHTCARTHTQTKNRLHSGRTRPTTIWNELLTQKELLLGRDIAVPFNQYCQNRCLYQRLLFILHQDRNSTWWSLGRKYNVANCFSRSEESRFMVEIAPKMHCNITQGVKEKKKNICMCNIADCTADRAVVLEEIMFTVHLKKKKKKQTKNQLTFSWDIG